MKRRWKPRALLVFAWASVIYCAALNFNLLANVHWYATLGLLGPLILLYPPQFSLTRRWPGLLAAAGLLAALLAAGFASPEPLRAVVHAGKIALVLLVLYPFFLRNPRCARTAFSAAQLGAVINLALIVLTALAVADLAEVRGAGRWHTVLNGRGSLACLGGTVFGFAAYGALAIRPISARHILLTAVSLALVLLDGNRAVAFALLLISALTIVQVRHERRFFRLLRPGLLKVAFCFATVMVAAQLAYSYGGGWGSRLRTLAPTARLSALWDYQADMSLIDYLEQLDPTRYSGMLTALEAIREHPVMGSGLGSTLSLEQNNYSVVHNAYLQAWADLGMLGLVCYTAFVLGWVPHLPRALRRIRSLPSANERALYFGAVASLLLFSCLGLSHPISVQVSMWIYFVVPASLYWRVAQPARAATA